MAVWLVWSLFAACLLVSTSQGEKNITAEPGQSVTLPCRAPNNNIQTLEWSRPDLGIEYVFLYRDGFPTTTNQHPSFKNRVELQDRQMKDGNVSLILKNVTMDDAGTYACRVKARTNRRKRANLEVDPISTIHLRVAPPGQTGGSSAVLAGLVVSGALVLVVGVVVFLLFKRSKDQKR